MNHIMMNFMNNYFNNGYSSLNSVDLTATETLPYWLSLSRMSTATRFDSTGTLVDSAIDAPRFDYGYDGTNWVNQGLLVEKQSTNLVHDAASNSSNSSNNTEVVSIPDVFAVSAVKAVRKVEGNNQSYLTNSTEYTTQEAGVPLSFYSVVGLGSSSAVSSQQTAGVQARYDVVNGVQVSTYGDFTGVTNRKPIFKRLSSEYFLLGAIVVPSKNSNTVTRLWTFNNTSNSEVSKYWNSVCIRQVEKSNYPTSFIKTYGTAATRSSDNLQLNLSNYTGSIKLTYKRQDTEVVETKWIDLTNATNPLIDLSVGVWLKSIKTFSRILTSWEKDYEKTKDSLYIDLDLTQMQTLPNNLILSRLSTATRFNNLGNLVDVSTDEARFDYTWNGNAWINQGLLIEKQSTNYSRSTEIANAAYHTGNNRSSVSNLSSSKFGKGIQLKAETTDNDQFFEIFNNIGNTNAITTYSIIKENDDSSANFTLFRRVNAYASFDSTFTNTNPGGLTNFPKQRIRKLGTMSAALSTTVSAALSNAAGSFYRTMMNNSGVLQNSGTVNIGQTLRVYRVQLEISSYPSSFINVPSTSSVTRSQDNLQLNLSNFTGSIRLTYKRQDTETIENKWIDLTNSSNPILTTYLDVGCWLKKVKVFSKILDTKEKNNIDNIITPQVIKEYNLLQSSTLDSNLVLTRLSSATYFDKTGALIEVGNDTPRFNYEWDGNKWNNVGLLVEKQSTNYIVSSLTTYERPVQSSAARKSQVLNKLNGLNTGCQLDRIAASGWVLLNQGVSSIATTGMSMTQYFEYGASNSATFRTDTFSRSVGGNYSHSPMYTKPQGTPWGSNNVTKIASSTVNIRNITSFSGSNYIGESQNTGSIQDNSIKIYAWQFESSIYPTSMIKTSGAIGTRAQDNLQLNLSSYTGSIQLVVKRQDTDKLDTVWIDLIESNNPILSDYLTIGVHLQKIRLYEKILTQDEKNFILGAGNV